MMDEKELIRIIEDFHALRLIIGEKSAYEVVKNNVTIDEKFSWQEKERILAELLSLHIEYTRKRET